MPKPDHSLRILLSRAERREIDRAAKAAGLKSGPWVRSSALSLARVAGNVAKAPVASNSGHLSPLHPGAHWICPTCRVHGDPVTHTCARVGSPSRPIRSPEDVKKALAPRSFDPTETP
jgi:hypothetical protein